MCRKKKLAEERFVIAVKDYNNTLESIKKGEISLPYDKEIYLKLFESQSSRADTLGDLGKFIRANKRNKKDVRHYWEALLVDGYSLLNVAYNERVPSLTHVCNSNVIKYIGAA